jgi:hypothetical protein
MCVGSRTRAGGLRAVLFATVATALMSLPARGALLDRDINGDPTATNADPATVFEYDTDLHLTWLRDGNYAQTSGFDADGLMNWPAAVVWTAALTVGTFSGWRLPTTNTGPSSNCSNSFDPGGGFPLHYGFDCTGSEMGWDFNTIAGSQVNPDKSNPFHAVAVRPDDVAALLPDPGSLVILAAGLWALVAAVRRRLRRVSLAPT